MNTVVDEPLGFDADIVGSACAMVISVKEEPIGPAVDARAPAANHPLDIDSQAPAASRKKPRLAARGRQSVRTRLRVRARSPGEALRRRQLTNTCRLIDTHHRRAHKRHCQFHAWEMRELFQGFVRQDVLRPKSVQQPAAEPPPPTADPPLTTTGKKWPSGLLRRTTESEQAGTRRSIRSGPGARPGPTAHPGTVILCIAALLTSASGTDSVYQPLIRIAYASRK